jgi:hypothetical protein
MLEAARPKMAARVAAGDGMETYGRQAGSR